MDWQLVDAARGMGEEFKSLQTSVMETIWFDSTTAQAVMRAISNEENQ